MVTRLGEIPLILAATTVDFEPKTYAEFITYAKANPGKVRYASVGVGSNNHYDTEAFAQWAGIKLTHIPNKGGGGAITNDVLRGDVHVVLVNAASSAGLAQAGKLRVLAVMADNGCRNIRMRRRSRSLATRTPRACGRRSTHRPRRRVMCWTRCTGRWCRRSAPRRCRSRSRSR